MAIRVELCGALTVEVDGRRVEDDLPGRQGRLLFAYLARNHDRPVRRDELVDVVWDDHPPGSPDAGLAALLTRVRQALGPDAVAGRAHLRLAGEVWVDLDEARAAAAEAEEALAAGDPRRAAERARAALERFERPLLPELAGRWVDEQRAELDGLHSDALETLARAALRLGGGELPAADRAARTLIQREPYRESGYALLMELLAARGNLAEALRVYDQLRVLLRDELGATPAPHVTALHDRLLMQDEAPAPVASGPRPGCRCRPSSPRARSARSSAARPSSPPLRRAWELGQGAVVVVVGEAGMGKTRLAARFAAEAHAGGAAVLHGRIDEETVVPFQPFVEALRHYVAHAPPVTGVDLEALAPLVPELGGVAAESGERENRRYRLFEAVAALLGRVAAERPLLLVVEDLQWAGMPTLLLLRHVVRRLEGAPLLVLVTMRDEEANLVADPARLLADLSREHVVERIALGGLEEADAAELVGDPELAHRLHGRTAGNPFFIEEMLRSLAEAPEAEGVPAGVKDLVSRRLARLEPETVEALTAAAVLGRDFRLATLEAMVRRPGEELLDALEEALRAGVVREDVEQVDRFAFAHALVRETLYDAPAHARRVRLHLRAGRALEAAGAPPGELAHHFFVAREVGGAEAAVEYSAAAARQAVAAHAYEEAAWHLGQALQVDRRADLLIALGDVRWQASEPGARAAFDEAVEVSRDPEILARAALGAGGRFYMPVTSDPAYVARLEEALAALGDAEGPLRARLLARLAEHLALAGAGDRPARARRRGGGDGAPRRRRRGARRRPDGPPRRAARHRARARAPRHDRRGGGRRRADRRRRGRRARAALAHLRPRRARRPRRRQGLPRPPRGARARAPPAALHALRARLARRVGARRRAAGRGRADPPRVAAGRRGRRLARRARLLPHPAVRRPPRPGPPRRAARPGRAARAPARRDRRHLARAAAARAAAGRGARARPRGLRGCAPRRAQGPARQPLPPLRPHLRRRGVRRRRRRAGRRRADRASWSRTPTASCRPRSAAAGARSGATSACSTRPPAARRRRASSCRARSSSTSPSTPRCWPRSPGAISPMYQASASVLCRASGNPPPTRRTDRGKEACRRHGPRDGVRGPGRAAGRLASPQ